MIGDQDAEGQYAATLTAHNLDAAATTQELRVGEATWQVAVEPDELGRPAEDLLASNLERR